MQQLRAHPLSELAGVAQAKRLILYTDGASRGNPGPAGIGVVLLDEDGSPLERIARYVGVTTNNQAEYHALLVGLEAAAHLGAQEVEVRLDSELIVKQMKGQYRVRSPQLEPLYRRARALLFSFPRSIISYIPRETNREADQLANLGIDSHRAG